MNRRIRACFIAFPLVAAGILCGCGKKDFNELAEQPAESVKPAAPAISESRITLNALFPYEMLSKALMEAFPAALPIQGRQPICMNVEREVQKTIQETIGGDVGKLVGAVVRIVTKVVTVGQVENLCLDVDYYAIIKRDGNVAISQVPNGVRLSVPVRADGHAGFVGALADFLKLNKKNFRGALTAQVDLDVGVNEEWCPTVKAIPDFSWSEKAQLEVAGRFWIDIDGEAGPAIKNAMSEAAAKIPSLITCDQIKALVQPMWHVYEVTLPAIAGQLGKVILIPQRVGFSGLAYTPTGVQLALMLTAKTQVLVGTPTAALLTAASSPVAGFEGLTAGAIALPRLETIPAQQNELNLAVPITVAYDGLNQEISSAITNKTFEGSGSAATASVKVLETRVYPSGERLVIGVRFESKVTGPKTQTTKGWVYFFAKPAFDTAAQTLTVTDIDFSRIIDNDLWAAMSFIFQDQIRGALQGAAKADLRPIIADARATLHKELATAAAKEGINIGLEDDFLGLSSVYMTDQGIQIVVVLRGSANIVVLNRLGQ